MKGILLFVCLYGIFPNIVAYGESFQWSSKSYTLKAILTVPGANISEPYQVWLDGNTGKSRVDFYGGMDKVYREYDEETEEYKYYKIHPVSTTNKPSKEVCNEVDAKAPETKMYTLNTYLPIKRWTFVGNENVNNVEAKKFTYEYPVRIQQKITGKIVYTVWIQIKNPGSIAVPVRFVYELIGEENKVLDNFQHDYTYFDGSKPDPLIVERPSNLKCKPLTVDLVHEPIDPLVEYIEPKLEHSRVKKAFDRFKTKYNKSYTNEDEHFKRMNVFKDNLRFINSFNRQRRSFAVGVNHLADLLKEEMLTFLGTFVKDNDKTEYEGSGDDDDDDFDENLSGVAANFDWRDYGAVTPVKDQTAICGSCYAFTAAAAIESSTFIARGCQDLEEISEQAIIDCTWGVTNDGNMGCSGGTYEYALSWVNEFGAPLKSEYGPYLAMEGRCHAKAMKMLFKIDGANKIEKKKREIKDALRENGPLLVSMDTNHLSFIFYASGVYDEPECSNNPMERNHGVTLVGYGRELGADHWVIKNSFGKYWGEGGYMRIATEKNRCGLKNHVYNVVLNKNKSSKCKPLK